MEEWVSIEIAPWRHLRLCRGEVIDRLMQAVTRDASIGVFRIREGIVTLEQIQEDNLTPGLLDLVTKRAALFRNFLQTVVSEHRIDCDIHLGMRLGDRGPEERHVPLFCFHKVRYETGILVPDLDFVISDFYASEDFRDGRRFADKRPEAYFVGATTGGIVTMDRLLSDGHERIGAARFFAEKPGITFEISQVVQCDHNDTRRMVEAMVPMARGWRSWQEQFAYRYLLSLDGNGATWSRTAVALASNSILVKYASAYQLHYFHGLQPWVHFIPVRKHQDVVDLIKGAARSAERDADIAEAGRIFAQRHLGREAIIAYTASLLRSYAAVFHA